MDLLVLFKLYLVFGSIYFFMTFIGKVKKHLPRITFKKNKPLKVNPEESACESDN